MILDWGRFSQLWWTVEHHFGRVRQFSGIFLLVSLPYIILENWAKRKVKLSYLRDSKKASSRNRVDERVIISCLLIVKAKGEPR